MKLVPALLLVVSCAGERSDVGVQDVPVEFVGTYVGTATVIDRPDTEDVMITIEADGRVSLQRAARDDGGFDAESYAGTIQEDGAFKFRSTGRDGETFSGKIVAGMLTGRTFDGGTPEYEVQARKE